jgi:uncharacterized LabA/DUF88 family protein
MSSSHNNNSYLRMNNSYNILNTFEVENNNENDTNEHSANQQTASQTSNQNNSEDKIICNDQQSTTHQAPSTTPQTTHHSHHSYNNNNHNSSSNHTPNAYYPPHLKHNNPTKLNQRYNDFLKTDRGKIMIFIDGSNLFYTAQMMGIEIDYIKLVDTLVGKDSLVRACFYAGIDGDRSQAANWHFFMKRSGFRMIMKQLQTFADGNRKANCDVEMAVDMINLSDSFDTAVVCTGDGDLTYAINALMNRGKQVEVVGSKYNTNDSLINTCDRFIDLESLRHRIIKAVRPSYTAAPQQ